MSLQLHSSGCLTLLWAGIAQRKLHGRVGADPSQAVRNEEAYLGKLCPGKEFLHGALPFCRHVGWLAGCGDRRGGGDGTSLEVSELR